MCCPVSGKPASAKKAAASAGLIAVRAPLVASSKVSYVRASSRRKAVLILAKACSIGLKSGD